MGGSGCPVVSEDIQEYIDENLYEAGKIQKVEPHHKFLPKKKQRIISGEAYVDYTLLTLEEQNDGAWS
jgi:hypothetical protein